MEKIEREINQSIAKFRLPRYAELPAMGLYLEQTTKYVNDCLNALGDVKLTPSMVSNYVKHQIICRPEKKLYGPEQLADLIFIAVAKNVLQLSDLKMGIEIQQESSFDVATAYDYFCGELENVLRYVFGYQDTLAKVGTAKGEQKKMLRSLIMAVSYKVYLDNYFSQAKDGE